MENSGTGVGKLFYEMPVVNALGRQMSSFEDLQKTLSQLGMVSGNHLLRFDFRKQ